MTSHNFHLYPSFQFLCFPFSPHPLLIFFLPSSPLPPSLSLHLTRPPPWFRQRSQESDTENDKAIRRKWEQFRNDTDARRMETYREDAFPSFQPCQPAPLSSSLFSLHFVKMTVIREDLWAFKLQRHLATPQILIDFPKTGWKVSSQEMQLACIISSAEFSSAPLLTQLLADNANYQKHGN